MEKVKKIRVSYDEESNTLDVWFDDPLKEYICEETVEEVILKKDKAGNTIGFEKLNLLSAKIWKKRPPVEVVVA
ncbi:MAG: DUF2283 domain-containing protein [Elusimicrobiota bacterium]